MANENELQVVVKQEPGSISWNFDELKEQLREITQSYENLIYTDDSITAAKADVANLRKLKTAVEDKRKDARRICLEPYEAIEAQAKELTALIDKPISAISKQVREYENKQKAERKEVIVAFMNETFSDLPEVIAKRLAEKCYDPKWENKTAQKKVWTDAINDAHKQAKKDLAILNNSDEDFREMALRVYEQNLVLEDALRKISELQQQREMLRINEAKKVQNTTETTTKENTKEDTKETTKEATEPIENIPEELKEVTLKIWVNKLQYARIIGYIQHTGAIFKEL